MPLKMHRDVYCRGAKKKKQQKFSLQKEDNELNTGVFFSYCVCVCVCVI